MANTNLISGTVKILENPKQKLINKTIPFVEFRVQFPQTENDEIIYLNFWGELGKDVINYYKINDYILIEGYLSFQDQDNDLFQKSEKIKLIVLNIYPLFLSSINFTND